MVEYLGRKRYTRQELRKRKLQLLCDLELYKNIKINRFNELINDREGVTLTGSLIYSSLISQTNRQKYTHKIVQCGDYYQVYNYNDYKVKKGEGRERVRDSPNICLTDTDNLYKIRSPGEIIEKKIETKNIYRSVFQLQRLIKANENEFKTFVTLTYEENEQDIEKCNKHFNSWRTYIKKLKSDFKYICVPEFQKRGAVHYHLLTNIDYTDFELLSKEEHKHHSNKYKKWSIGRYIVGWNKGFSFVEDMYDKNMIGYITKYLTKDIDNRLWGKRRYLYSLNLKQSSTIYIDINDIEDNSKLSFIELFSNLEYSNVYCDKLGQAIEFKEYKRKKF